MYNLRYHIASLVAVFLALAVGLLLGTVVAERGVLDGQRASLVQSLQTDFSGLRKENTELKRERDRDRAFASDLVPVLTRGLLKGKRVLVVTNAGRTDALAYTRDALEIADADVVVATFKEKNLGLAQPAVADAVSEVVTATAAEGATDDSVVRALAAEWTRRGGGEPLTAVLKSAGQLTVEGGGDDMRPDAVVILASWDGQGDQTLVSLAAEMQKAGIRAVGAEAQTVATGAATAALGGGLSTVDDVDLPEGSVSLVYVLAGKAEGQFGMNAGASSPYPKLP